MMEDPGYDMIRKRPRTPNDQYSVLTETQMKNIRNNPNAFFHNPNNAKAAIYGYPNWDRNKRHTIERTVKQTSRHLYRGNSMCADPVCWMGEKYTRNIPEYHNTARLGASLRWGPSKTGQRSYPPFDHSNQFHRFHNIDVYKRPSSNQPRPCVMSYGRPGDGYYTQRNPNETTWFGSTVPLNRTDILVDVLPKTLSDYKEITDFKKEHISRREKEWPAYSEYTDSFALQSKAKPKLTHMDRMKLHVMQSEAYTNPKAEVTTTMEVA